MKTESVSRLFRGQIKICACWAISIPNAALTLKGILPAQ